MTDPRRDELAHMRRFDVSSLHPDKITGVRVHRVTGLLRDVLTSVGTIATVHPNIVLDDLQWPGGRQLWPVTVRDPERQVQIVEDLVNAALDGGSRLIVLPELSATDGTIAAVRALIDARYDEDEDPAIVLVGSQHVELGDGQRRNRAVTLISGTPVELHHDKLIPFRIGEAIEDLQGDGTLHLYQDGPFRLAAVVCKDLLDSDVEHALERLGVNLLLVPAMSVKTPNLPLAAARLLHTAQTVTVIANSPLVDDQAGRSLAHCSLTARPTADGPAVVSWPSGGAHAPKPQAPVWVGHPFIGGNPRASPQSH
jgi:predicted amidohydrolase